MKTFRAFIVLLLLTVSTSIQAQFVYKTPSGAKYHLATCRMIENVSQKLTLDQAAEKGLTPCKICKPAVVAVLHSNSTAQRAQGQGTTVQCRGITKKRTRCLHRTRIANGYCAQHNPDK